MIAAGRVACALLLAAGAALAQDSAEQRLSDPSPGRRIKAVRSVADGTDIARTAALLDPLLADESEEVRLEVVKAFIRMRSIDAQPYLVKATVDLTPRLQILATDGLVDFYEPGYANIGRLGTLKGLTSSVISRFRNPNPVVVPPYVRVAPTVIDALGEQVRNGRSEPVRANAARAIGVLRGGAALDALLEGVRSRDPTIMRESVLAIKKIRDPRAGPGIVFLLRDPDFKLQIAAIETLGQLRTAEAAPELVRVVEESTRKEVRIAAMIALAKIPDSGQRVFFLNRVADPEAGIRAAAAEGLGRNGQPLDLTTIGERYRVEKNASARLSLAFAYVSLGNLVPLESLVDALQSRVHRGEARPFLVELARKPKVLERLYVPLGSGSVAQRRQLAQVVAQSGGEESVAHLQNLVDDPTSEVSNAAIDALRVLQYRLAAD